MYEIGFLLIFPCTFDLHQHDWSDVAPTFGSVGVSIGLQVVQLSQRRSKRCMPIRAGFSRGQGLGTALLDEAEARALDRGCPGLALVVATSNTGAVHAYVQAGYREMARRPFDLSDFGLEPTEALLMVKDLS